MRYIPQKDSVWFDIEDRMARIAEDPESDLLPEGCSPAADEYLQQPLGERLALADAEGRGLEE